MSAACFMLCTVLVRMTTYSALPIILHDSSCQTLLHSSNPYALCPLPGVNTPFGMLPSKKGIGAWLPVA